MSNLPTDKYTIFMVDTDMMTPEQYKDLANANYTVYENCLTDFNENYIPEDDIEKSYRDHEKLLLEVKLQDEGIDRCMELGEEGV